MFRGLSTEEFKVEDCNTKLLAEFEVDNCGAKLFIDSAMSVAGLQSIAVNLIHYCVERIHKAEWDEAERIAKKKAEQEAEDDIVIAEPQTDE